jgi:hypothetical protein
MYMYVCIYVCIHVFMRVCINAHRNTPMYLHTHSRKGMCNHKTTPMWMQTLRHKHVHVHKHENITNLQNRDCRYKTITLCMWYCTHVTKACVHTFAQFAHTFVFAAVATATAILPKVGDTAFQLHAARPRYKVVRPNSISFRMRLAPWPSTPGYPRLIFAYF